MSNIAQEETDAWIRWDDNSMNFGWGCHIHLAKSCEL